MSELNTINKIEADIDRISAEYEEKEAFVDKFAKRGDLALKSFALVLKIEIDEGKTLVKIAKELLAELKKKKDVKMSEKTDNLSLPKWCKEGQWVLINNTLCKFVEVNDDPYYPFTFKDVHGQCVFAHPLIACPVRFRPYKYEEAKGLIGKVMEYERSGTRIAHIIYAVDEYEEVVEINKSTQSTLIDEFHATIDGVPMGVPEVDRAAMLEDEQ